MTRSASRVHTAAAVALLVGTLTISGSGLAYAAAGSGISVDDLVTSLAAVGTALVGVLIVRSGQAGAVGWIFALIGLTVAALVFVDPYAAYVTGSGDDPNVVIAWCAEWWWLPMLFCALVFWPMLFPDGHLPGSRWRIPFAAAVVTCVVASVLAALDPVLDTDDRYAISNPVGIDGLGDVEDGVIGVVVSLLFVGFVLTAIASLILRFRRSRGRERDQIKWITLGGVLLVLTFLLVAPVVETVTGHNPQWLYSLAFLLIPVSVGLAVLRHGLFDVDVVIRRTVVYATLTVLLGAAYAGLVLLAQGIFASVAGGSDLAIAVSTLIVAALFLPVRGKVQAFVDRRFYRRRYDAQRTLALFGSRLRNEIDLDGLTTDLQSVVVDTMQPAAVSLWLREAPR